MTDPNLVISHEAWEEMSNDLKSKITYETVISMRGDVLSLTRKIDDVINKPKPPCEDMNKRVCKLEKWKIAKVAATILSSFLGGVGGSHLPK